MYKLNILDLLGNQSSIIRLLDNAYIPFDPANVDFQQYQVWLSEGNTPLPADNGTSPLGQSI
jgi:hypothetical protein